MASLRSDKSSVGGAFSSSEDLLAQLDPPERKIRQRWLAARARARRSPRSIRVDTKLARESSGKIPEEDTPTQFDLSPTLSPQSDP
eukprot:CAMPEP_0119278340 /NCGR_PEP_ID=MMETSP1329-20130426/18909_1 /TAXON_ID=114041 /ORGANISM="Genus nov. species nov., Strain RCC1024" /LENGTH=85 /DNA_ID=CAMNT_0007278851 /DNA_START=177 /DNA_END=431 /DNA_ORIENTATION=-